LDRLNEWEVEYTENYDISRQSFIGIGALARLAVFPETKKKLIKCVSFLFENAIPFKTVGALSNILFKDPYFDGVIVETQKLNRFFIEENRVKLECGVRISKIHLELTRNGLSGFEEISGIPGTLCGMIYSNAGAFGATVSDHLDFAQVYDLKRKECRRALAKSLDLSYRHSAFLNGNLVLLYASFTLKKAREEEISARTAHFKTIRMKTQPYNEMSLGSVFKREGDIPVSRLIDMAGLKGLCVGGACVSEKHAGFIVNRGSASASDVLRLIEIIKKTVYERYGVTPREEIEII
jgi:UDP-N-acetylmuramate dehydrogenase